MTLNINIDVNQIIQIIGQLPNEQKKMVKYEIDKSLANKKSIKLIDDFTHLLLKGPVMTQEDEDRFKRINKDFEEWTKNVFA